jgi:hypothetical protein
MKADKGDRVVVKAHHVGEAERDGEILEVRGESGSPPYLVRWSETGHTALFFPGPDTIVQHFSTKSS